MPRRTYGMSVVTKKRHWSFKQNKIVYTKTISMTHFPYIRILLGCCWIRILPRWCGDRILPRWCGIRIHFRCCGNRKHLRCCGRIKEIHHCCFARKIGKKNTKDSTKKRKNFDKIPTVSLFSVVYTQVSYNSFQVVPFRTTRYDAFEYFFFILV